MVRNKSRTSITVYHIHTLSQIMLLMFILKYLSLSSYLRWDKLISYNDQDFLPQWETQNHPEH